MFPVHPSRSSLTSSEALSSSIPPSRLLPRLSVDLFRANESLWAEYFSEKSKENPLSEFDWNRSISEPDLTDSSHLLDRFVVRNLHEHVSVDDLKFYRRKRPPDLHTHSNFCLYNEDEPVLPFGSFKSEYTTRFRNPERTPRPGLLRRSTSLHLEGSMNTLTETQSKYLPYSQEDIQSCRTHPIRNPETLQFPGEAEMSGEYRSSYISYPMVDKTCSILPREAFKVSDCDAPTTDDRFKRAVPDPPRKSQRQGDGADMSCAPSEYRRQFIQFPIERAHSIPQLSHIKMLGDFIGVPEYRDNYKMYDCYSKSAPIKKADNLKISGEVCGAKEVPEYREKFKEPPKISKEKPLKTEDHLHPRGEFSKDIPEYFESFRDPQVKEKPERGKCREPYLRLKGKIEFNPEYRSTYLDYPRSRPVVKKATSSLRLSNATTTTTAGAATSPRRKNKSTSPNRYVDIDPTLPLTHQPEYRRAQYNYQIRERTPPHRIADSLPEPAKGKGRENLNLNGKTQKRRPSRHRQVPTTIGDLKAKQESFESVGSSKKQAKFGRRASIVPAAREKAAIAEGNLKYAAARTRANEVLAPSRKENKESFVVLKEPCKKSAWMKKSWYES